MVRNINFAFLSGSEIEIEKSICASWEAFDNDIGVLPRDHFPLPGASQSDSFYEGRINHIVPFGK